MLKEDARSCKSFEDLHDSWKDALSKEADYKPVENDEGKKVAINSYYKDGIVDEECFKKGERLLFILNEASIDYSKDNKSNHIGLIGDENAVGNDSGDTIESFKRYSGLRGEEMRLEEYKNHKWKNKARFKIGEMYRIWVNDISTYVVDEKEDNKNREAVANIAFINLNKRGGFGKISKNFGLYIKKYQEYIRREIELINPSVIIWCGHNTFDAEYPSIIFEGIPIMDKADGLAGKVTVGEKLIKLIKMWHPSSYGIPEEYEDPSLKNIYNDNNVLRYLSYFKNIVDKIEK